jgi:hypothetical protein
LTSLTKADKKLLLSQGTVICRQIAEQPGLLKGLGVNSTKQKRIIQEAKDLSYKE